MEKILELVVAFQTRVSSPRRSERGATGTEYAILVSVIALVLILGATVFGNALSTFFSKLGNHVSGWAAGL